MNFDIDPGRSSPENPNTNPPPGGGGRGTPEGANGAPGTDGAPGTGGASKTSAPPVPAKKPNPVLTVFFAAVAVFFGGVLPSALTTFLFFGENVPVAGGISFGGLTVGCFYPGVFGSPGVGTWVVCISVALAAVLATVILSVFVRGVRAILLPLLTAVFAAGLLGPFAGVAVLLTVLTSALCSYLALMRGVKPLFSALFAALSLGVAYLLTGDIAVSLISVIPFVTSLFLSHAHADRAVRVEAVIRTAAGFCISSALVAAAFARIRYGQVSITGLTDAINALRPGVTRIFTDYGAGMIDEKTAGILTDSIFNLLPGLVLLVAELAGYLIQRVEVGLHLGQVYRGGKPVLKRREADEFSLTVYSGVLFTLCAVIRVFGGNGPFFTVLDNFMLVFTPPMIVVGVVYIIAMCKTPGSRFRILTPVFLVLVILLYGAGSVAVILEALALVGAVSLIYLHWQKRLLDRLIKENQNRSGKK